VRFVNSKPQAEDIFQETCLQIHLSIDSFDTDRPFKPWLFTIAANKARDFLRRTSQRQTARLMAPLDGDGDSGRQFMDLLEAQLPTPDQEVQKEETRELVRQAVASLPENMREILILAYFHSVPYKEIAQRLGIPLGTVKSRLHAAVGTFAQRWREGQEKG
jgi:RNA polymerase sigma-70 factor, ECF subfamily